MPISKTGRPKKNILEDELTQKLLRILKYNGGIDRKELVRRTGAPRTTIYARLVKLHILGVVYKRKKQYSKRKIGRPGIIWGLVHE